VVCHRVPYNTTTRRHNLEAHDLKFGIIHGDSADQSRAKAEVARGLWPSARSEHRFESRW